MTNLICSFDTETTGIGPDARLVELGVVLLDTEGQEHGAVSVIIYPDGFEIPPDIAKIHGIDTARARMAGIPAVVAIAALTNMWSLAATRIAYNIEFDDKIIDTEIRILKRPSIMRRPKGICVKEMATPVLNLPPTQRMIDTGYGNKPKAPKLLEAHEFLFGEGFAGAHSALNDARACARVYRELLRRQQS